MTDHRTIQAARNNADWYAMMFDVHGLKYARTEIAFLAIDSPPRYHSWINTIDPTAQTHLLHLITQNRHHPGFVIKDSFDCLNLGKESFNELFSATWIYAETVPTADTSNWIQISSASDLLLWELAWKDDDSPSIPRQFPDAILARDEVVIWGRHDSSKFDAGVIANVSTDCVGLSNCFGKGAYPAAATLCAELAQELPVVGYERGDDLADALDTGFATTGTLRVWGKPA